MNSEEAGRFLVIGGTPEKVLTQMKVLAVMMREDERKFRRELRASVRCFGQVVKALEANPWLSKQERNEIVREVMGIESLKGLKKFAKQLPCRLAHMKWCREHSTMNGGQNGSIRLETTTAAECESGPEPLEELQGRASLVQDSRARALYQEGIAARRPREKRRAFCKALRLDGMASNAPPPENPKWRWKKG